MASNANRGIVTVFLSTLAVLSVASPPQYQIYDLGLAQAGDTVSQGFRVSTNGVATGRSVHSGGSEAFSWTVGGGTTALPVLTSPARPFCEGNDANDNGIVVGVGATSLSGNSRLPLMWQNGVLSQLPLPAGQTLGDANGVNSSGVAVGSVNAGTPQRGAIYANGVGSIITTTTANGSYFVTAFAINDSGMVIGQGIDPNNAAVNVGMMWDSVANVATSVGALPGMNGALAFDVSNSGFVVGSSMLNQGSGTPFIWSAGGGMTAIPFATGTSQGSAKGVNSAGWVVGTDSSAFAIPFLWDGTSTYRIGDLLTPGSGWDLLTNTSSSALSISDNGIIVGTGLFNGNIHGYAMVPVPEPATIAAMGLGVALLWRRRRAG